MNLNQITIGVTDIASAIDFYENLGLTCIVHTHDAYARFECPIGGSTFSIHTVDKVNPGTTLIYFEVEDVDSAMARLALPPSLIDSSPKDRSFLWREARIRDPFGNHLCIYHAGENRLNPPWRKEGT